MWKETVIDQFELQLRNLCGVRMKTVRNVSLDCPSLGRDLNPRPPEYETELLTRPICSLNLRLTVKTQKQIIQFCWKFQNRSALNSSLAPQTDNKLKRQVEMYLGRLCYHFTAYMWGAFNDSPLKFCFRQDLNLLSLVLCLHATLGSRDNSFGIATGYGLDRRVCKSLFLLSVASRPTLGPTQSPIQCELPALSPGVKGSGREADHSLPSSAEVKKGGAIPSFPVHLHGVVLN
jgi:hypothetical protein